jgi:hypothetical protein
MEFIDRTVMITGPAGKLAMPSSLRSAAAEQRERCAPESKSWRSRRS